MPDTIDNNFINKTYEIVKKALNNFSTLIKKEGVITYTKFHQKGYDATQMNNKESAIKTTNNILEFYNIILENGFLPLLDEKLLSKLNNNITSGLKLSGLTEAKSNIKFKNLNGTDADSLDILKSLASRLHYASGFFDDIVMFLLSFYDRMAIDTDDFNYKLTFLLDFYCSFLNVVNQSIDKISMNVITANDVKDINLALKSNVNLDDLETLIDSLTEFNENMEKIKDNNNAYNHVRENLERVSETGYYKIFRLIFATARASNNIKHFGNRMDKAMETFSKSRDSSKLLNIGVGVTVFLMNSFVLSTILGDKFSKDYIYDTLFQPVILKYYNDKIGYSLSNTVNNVLTEYANKTVVCPICNSQVSLSKYLKHVYTEITGKKGASITRDFRGYIDKELDSDKIKKYKSKNYDPSTSYMSWELDI